MYNKVVLNNIGGWIFMKLKLLLNLGIVLIVIFLI